MVLVIMLGAVFTFAAAIHNLVIINKKRLLYFICVVVQLTLIELIIKP